MDYHSMKRKELQALCKEHNIPANSTNSVMADKLSLLLNATKKPTTQQRTCLKSSDENIDENEAAVTRRQAKKVRFSPNNELVEYELRSGKKEKVLDTETKHTGKAVAKKVDKLGVNKKTRNPINLPDPNEIEPKPVVDNDNIVELIDDVQIPVKLTRSRVEILEKDGIMLPVNEKKQDRRAVKVKQGKRAVKDVEKASESVEETAVGLVRVTRSKAQMLEDGVGPDLNPRVKKKGGRKVAKDSENVEPIKAIVDIPVRVTRSREQTLKDSIGNKVASPQLEKKRTRREAKVDDSSSNSTVISGNSVLEDYQELPKRRSLRNKEVEIADKDGEEKLGHGGRKKISKESITEVPKSQYHADKGSRRSTRNEAKVQDSTVETNNDGKITRSKAQLAVKSFEEPANRPAGKNTRGKSVIQKVEEKGIDKPNVGTRKTLGRKHSIKQSGDLSMIDEGLEDKENVTILGKEASGSEMKIAASATGSHRSRKRRGDPVIEGQAIEVDHASLVDESSRRSTRSSGKSEGKVVTYPPQNSGLKTERSGSKKRAKLTVNPHAEKPNTEGTPVSKIARFETDEVTPTGRSAIDASPRRLTRSTIRSERNAVGSLPPRQLAIKGQPIGDVQSSSHKVAEFRVGLATNETPRRSTRSGIKRGGHTTSKLFEKVDKKKHPRQQSAIKAQSLDNAQMSSPVVAEVKPDPGVTSAAKCERTQVDLPNLEDEIPSVAEVAGATPDALSDGSHAHNEEHEVYVKSATSNEAEVSPVVNLVGTSDLKSSRPEAHEHGMELTKSGSGLERRQINEIVEEHVVPVGKTAVLQESVDISPGKNHEDAISSEAGFSSVCHVSVQKSDLKNQSEKMKTQLEPSISEAVEPCAAYDGVFSQIENGFEQDADNGKYSDEDKSASAQKQLMSKPVSEDNKVNDSIDVLEIPENRNVADGVDAREMGSVCDHSTNNDVRPQGLAMDENDAKDDMVTSQDSLAEHGEPSTGKKIINNLDVDRCDVDDDGVDDRVDAGREPTKEFEFDVVQSTGNDVRHDVVDGSIDANTIKVAKSDSMPSAVGNMLEDPVLNGGDVEDEGANANKEHESDPKPSTSKDDDFDVARESEPVSEPSTANKILEIECDNSTDDFGPDLKLSTGNNVARESEPVSEPSTANKILEIECDNSTDDFGPDLKLSTGNNSGDLPGVGKDDAEDDDINVAKEIEPGSEPLAASELQPSADNDASDTLLGKDDLDPTKELEPDSEPKAASELQPSAGNDASDTQTSKDDLNAGKEIEPDSEPLAASELQPSAGNDASDTLSGKDDLNTAKELEPDSEPLTASELHSSASNDASDTLTSKDDLYATKELEPDSEPLAASELQPLAGNDASDTLTGKDDLNATKELESDREASTHNNTVEIHVVACDLEDECVDANKNLENESEPLTNNYKFETPFMETLDVLDCGNDRQDGESEQDQLTCIDGPSIQQDVGSDRDNILNENMSMVPEVLITSSDQEPKAALHVDECASIQQSDPSTSKESMVPEVLITSSDQEPETALHLDECAPIRQSDPSTSKETPQTPAVIGVDAQEATVISNYDLGDIVGHHDPVSANQSDDVFGQTTKDDRESVSVAESSSPDGKSNQDVDTRNANVDLTEEFFNWSEDSSLKTFFTTPVASRISNLKDNQEDVAGFTFSDDRYENMGKNGTATHDISRQWENEPMRVFNNHVAEETQDPPAHIPNFEDFSQRYFDDKVAGSGDTFGKNEEFDNLLNDEAGTSNNDASGLKDNSTHSGEFDEKEETQLEGSKIGEGLSFDKGDISRNKDLFNFKDDQDDNLLNEEAGTSNHVASYLKDNTIPCGEFEEKEEAQPKGSEMSRDLYSDKGAREM